MKSMLRGFLSAALTVASTASLQAQTTKVPTVLYKEAQQARQLRLQGKAAESVEALKPIAVEHPDFFFAQYNLGLAYQSKGDTPAAISALTKAKEIREKDKIADATIYNSLGWVYLSGGNYQQALKEFKTAEKPENFSALSTSSQQKLLNNIAVTYAFSGDSKLANEYFAKAKGPPKLDQEVETAGPAK
jgi:Flp pilus assembly protein TadD